MCVCEWQVKKHHKLHSQHIRLHLLLCYSCVMLVRPSNCCLSRWVLLDRPDVNHPGRESSTWVKFALTPPSLDSTCPSDPVQEEKGWWDHYERKESRDQTALVLKGCSFGNGLKERHSLSTVVHGKICQKYLNGLWREDTLEDHAPDNRQRPRLMKESHVTVT